MRTAALLLLLTGALGCGHPKAGSPPNVLLVVVDTLRADRLGAYGSTRGLTPFLDELAGRGVVFANAYATSSWTVPSMASLFTSRYAAQHGVSTFTSAVSENEIMLAEKLTAQGFLSGGFSANALLGRIGCGRGFGFWKVFLMPDRPEEAPYMRASQLSRRALRWVDQAWSTTEGRPALLYLHFVDPHSPYDPPEPFRSRFVLPEATREMTRVANSKIEVSKDRAPRLPVVSDEEAVLLASLYDGEVAYLDHELRSLFVALASRGFLDNAVIVFTSDHGEEFHEHGGIVHGQSLYEELVRVPLIVLAPAGEGGRVVRQPVSLLDVAPTVLELLGLAPEPRFEGRSLAPLLEGREASGADVIVERPHDGAYDRSAHSWGIIRGSKKLLIGRDRSAVLFDLAEDPLEASPASPSSSPEGPELRATLERRGSGFTESGAQNSQGAPLTEAEKERLGALGYLVE